MRFLGVVDMSSGDHDVFVQSWRWVWDYVGGSSSQIHLSGHGKPKYVRCFSRALVKTVLYNAVVCCLRRFIASSIKCVGFWCALVKRCCTTQLCVVCSVV